MQLRRIPPRTESGLSLTGIAPIYKVSLEGIPELIGTGFWVTEAGHLITAWHVIGDNVGPDGVDRGPIYALQALSNGKAIPRVLRKSCRHPLFDLAFSETLDPPEPNSPPTSPITMTLEEPKIGDPVSTHAFVSPLQTFDGEKHEGISTARFDGTLAIPDLGVIFDLSFGGRLGFGEVTGIFAEGRDSVLLPFPCFQSDIPLYGANSGGPVFDRKGRVCAINCTSFAGADISFHIPTKGILDLWARNIECAPEDPATRNRSVAELGLNGRALFHPSLERYYLPFLQRLYVRCARFLFRILHGPD